MTLSKKNKHLQHIGICTKYLRKKELYNTITMVTKL